MTPILENGLIEPTPGDIAWTDERFRELLAIRQSSRLFRLGSGAEVKARVTFPIGGPNQTPGVIVMRISDTVGADLDPNARSIVVVFNASDTTQAINVPGASGKNYLLHKVQQTSKDKTVKDSKFKKNTGTFTVPAWTTAVFVEGQ
jgi:pullulanase/glycogen debranching enzyme